MTVESLSHCFIETLNNATLFYNQANTPIYSKVDFCWIHSQLFLITDHEYAIKHKISPGYSYYELTSNIMREKFLEMFPVIKIDNIEYRTKKIKGKSGVYLEIL